MRKYKQVKEKKVIYSLDEWVIIEQRDADLAMKTGTYIKRISVDGQITHYHYPTNELAPNYRREYQSDRKESKRNAQRLYSGYCKIAKGGR